MNSKVLPLAVLGALLPACATQVDYTAERDAMASSSGGTFGSGGASSGGTSTGGTGAWSSGGTSTGGTSTGTTGGISNGGASTGGTSTGGASTGGASSGGTGGTGGTTSGCATALPEAGATVAGNECVHLDFTADEKSWVKSVIVQPHTGSYPINFTWTNCTGNSGSGTFTADYATATLTPVDPSCPVLLSLGGTSASFAASWWGGQ